VWGKFNIILAGDLVGLQKSNFVHRKTVSGKHCSYLTVKGEAAA
jgi:hypothetical protein